MAYEIVNRLEQQQEKVAFLALVDSLEPRIDRVREAENRRFDLESELTYVASYFGDNEQEAEAIRQALRRIDRVEHFWAAVVDYLEAGDFDVELIKRVILEYGMQGLPNYQRLNLRESVYYLNVGRTLTGALDAYIPGNKIHTPMHYFAARESREELNANEWEKYTAAPVTFHEIEGDHFSIFRMPHAADLAGQFAEVITRISNQIPVGEE